MPGGRGQPRPWRDRRLTALPSVAGYFAELLIQGFPGKSLENGGLGWSAIVLLRGNDRIVLVDTGSFSARGVLLKRLAERGISRHDVTDVLLTHSHYDHAMNWCLFPQASIWISGAELDWALQDPIETSLVPEFYIQALSRSPQLRRIEPGSEPIPRVRVLEMPGHTPHHLIFILEDAAERLILAGDAVKNRAELLSNRGDLTLDAGVSARSIASIQALWLEREGAILVAGHDLPMANEGGVPKLLGTRRAALAAWFDDDLDAVTRIALDRS